MNFFKKLKSEEYLLLLKEIQTIKISLEGLKLDIELYKKKLRVKNKLDSEEEETKDIYNKVLLPM